MICLTFRQGYCNGYVHEYLVVTTYTTCTEVEKTNTKLIVEITCRLGPAVCFKIMRTTFDESVVRTIGIPTNEQLNCSNNLLLYY